MDLRMTLASVCVAMTVAAGGYAMTEAELQQLYLDVVEDAVATFEPIWKDDSERVPNAGYFDFNEYGNWRDEPYCGIIVCPGNGMIALCYAVLLTQTDKAAFTDDAVPRSVIEDHALKAIRWLALTSMHAKTPYPYAPYAKGPYIEGEQWKRPLAYRADMQGWLTVAAALLWDRLDAELKGSLEPVFVGESQVEYRPYTWSEREGGLHDCVKHYLSSLTGAAFLCPQREEGAQAMANVRQSGIDIVATWHDRANGTEVGGKPVRDWVKSWNLYQDYSSDHHAHAQIWYGCDLIFEARTYLELLSRLTGIPVPETYTYEGNGFDGVLEWVKRISLPEAEPAPVHGAEYDSYYGAGLLAYCYGAVVKKDPVAAALEERAARLLQRQSRAIRQYDYHRNSWAKAAAAYLMHRLAGPRAEPVPMAEALGRLEGAYHHRSQLNLVHRAPDKWASFSWGILPGGQTGSRCGVVVPAQPDDAVLEPLVYVHPNSMEGAISIEWQGDEPAKAKRTPSYTYEMTDAGLHTAGVIEAPGLDQYHAFFSFANGPCVLFTKFKAHRAGTLSWTGVPIYFYAREGMTSSRQLYCEAGPQALEQAGEYASSWWCVADRLGAVVVGGAPQVRVERGAGFNWARIPEYRDACDGVWLSPVAGRAFEAGDTPVDVAVAFFANTPHEEVAAVAASAGALLPGLPDGWQGLVVPGPKLPGKRYFALANLDGEATQTTLGLAFPEGAPILSAGTRLEGASGRAAIQLAPRESYGQVVELYGMATKGAAAITKRTANTYLVEPMGAPAEIALTYTGGGEPEFRVRPASAASEEAASILASESNAGGHRTLTLSVDGPVVLEIDSEGYQDRVGPAVEIADVTPMADGRVTVAVTAGDQSGVGRVALHLDGKPLGEKSRPPYEWTLWPGKGYHTFYAEATDASPNHNTRRSFLRTVRVEVAAPPF